MFNVKSRLRHATAVGALLACVLLAAACAAKPARGHADGAAIAKADTTALRATLDKHLAAINARDLDALMSTVTDGEKLTTILPNGKVLATRDAYHQLHVDWFKDTDWRMVFAVEDVERLGDAGIARVRYDSQARQADGSYASKRIAQLTLVFQLQQGQWRLVYDQNTVVPPPAD